MSLPSKETRLILIISAVVISISNVIVVVHSAHSNGFAANNPDFYGSLSTRDQWIDVNANFDAIFRARGLDAPQLVNVGHQANDGTGDTFKVALGKVNHNLERLR